MRKILPLLAFIIQMTVNAIPAKADFTYEGIVYSTLTDSTCAVAVYNGISDAVIIPEKVMGGYENKEYRVTEIGQSAFLGCSSLTSIKIPNSVTTIEWSAFRGCSSLTSVDIPNSVTTIEISAFTWCSSLTSVDIPNSVTTIGWSAFSGCSSLTSVDIPNSVTAIDDYAFNECSELMYLTIGNSVEEIGEYAFFGCPNLKSVTSLSVLPPSAYRSTFSPDSYAATLNIPKGTYDLYKQAECWRWFISTAEFTDNSILEIPSDADGNITIHNISGHRLTSPQRGINIINGKKVLKR